ncbi:MAG: SPFH domain-containing protein [Anaerolineae bacterium]|nr:SPFH domain-containing protein [Gemmatimonadaceae bacterium]
MTLGQFIRKQFVDVIQWTEPENGILSYRFPMRDMEIQIGAQLTVRESQAALFVDEGRIADVFAPGRHRLDTDNLPLLTNLMHWDKFFESPFKSDVYFVSTRLQLNQRWGTSNPITVRDLDFGIVRLRAFGTYSYRITDPVRFHTAVSGTREIFLATDLEGQLRSLVVARMTDVFASSGIAFVDMASNQIELGERIGESLGPDFSELGLALESLVVTSLSLPEILQKRLDERIGMNIVGDLGQYTRFRVGQSIPLAAANQGGGGAAAGAGLGAGMLMAQEMMQFSKPSGAATAPPAGETKFCSACGVAGALNARFCSECGVAHKSA